MGGNEAFTPRTCTGMAAPRNHGADSGTRAADGVYREPVAWRGGYREGVEGTITPRFPIIALC